MGEEHQDLQRVRELEPEETRDERGGVPRDSRGRELALAEEDNEGVEELVQFGEVECVGPKEDATRGARAHGEAREPPETGLGSGPP